MSRWFYISHKIENWGEATMLKNHLSPSNLKLKEYMNSVNKWRKLFISLMWAVTLLFCNSIKSVCHMSLSTYNKSKCSHVEERRGRTVVVEFTLNHHRDTLLEISVLHRHCVFNNLLSCLIHRSLSFDLWHASFEVRSCINHYLQEPLFLNRYDYCNIIYHNVSWS